MRLVNGDVNVYYMHDTLTPDNVQAASYSTDGTSGALVPEVGDILHNFPGWTGEEYEPITVRVAEVESIGVVVEAYEVRATTVPADEPPALPQSVLDLIESLTDSDFCWFDRHGGCQAHGYLSLEPGEKCPQQEAKELVEAARAAAGDPMPVFVIEAKDEFAVSAVSAYRHLCEARGLDEQAEQVRLAAAEMSAWRERHPAAVKLPSYTHVPVA